MEKDTTQLVRKAIKGSKSAYGELIAAYQVCLYRAKKQLKNLLSNQTTQSEEGLRYAK